MSCKRERLADVAKVVNGFAFPERYQGDSLSTIPFIKVSDFAKAENGILSIASNYVNDSVLKEVKAKIYPKGTIIFPKVGGALLTNKRAILGCDATFDNNIMGLIPINIEAKYLYLFMHSFDMAKIANQTSLPSVRASDVENIQIPLPSEEIQLYISSKLNAQLSEIEKARAAVEVALNDLKQLEFLVFEHFLSVVKNIKKLKIGEYVTTSSGSTPSRGNKRYWESGEIPWVKTGEIAFKPIVQVQEHITELALEECSIKLLPENTVLIAMYGQGKTRGQSAILKVPATINQACFAIHPNDTWHPEFLQIWLQYSYQELRSMSDNRGGNQANLNGTLLNSLEVPAPPITQQKELAVKISGALHEVNIMKENWNKKKVEINNLPNRILTEAFKNNENGKN